MKTTFGLAAAALAGCPATDPEPTAIAPAAAAAATSSPIPILDVRRRAMVCREHDDGSDIPVNAPDGRNEEGDTRDEVHAASELRPHRERPGAVELVAARGREGPHRLPGAPQQG